MNDFTSPLEELLSTLESSFLLQEDGEDGDDADSVAKEESQRESSPSATDEKSILLGNKLLVYISCCLAGRAYPMGDIPDHLIGKVKDDIFHFLVTPFKRSKRVGGGGRGGEEEEEEATYPYVRTFLLFDTREFLNVLTFAFEEPEFTLQRRQAIVDILLKGVFVTVFLARSLHWSLLTLSLQFFSLITISFP